MPAGRFTRQLLLCKTRWPEIGQIVAVSQASESSESGIDFAGGPSEVLALSLPAGHLSQPQRSEESLVGSATVLLHRLTCPSEFPTPLDKGRHCPLAPAQPETSSLTASLPSAQPKSPSFCMSRPCHLPWDTDHRVLAFNSRGH